jgi:hypothetical protein
MAASWWPSNFAAGFFRALFSIRIAIEVTSTDQRGWWSAAA